VVSDLRHFLLPGFLAFGVVFVISFRLLNTEHCRVDWQPLAMAIDRAEISIVPRFRSRHLGPSARSP
jgi:hypothetical protein